MTRRRKTKSKSRRKRDSPSSKSNRGIVIRKKIVQQRQTEIQTRRNNASLRGQHTRNDSLHIPVTSSPELLPLNSPELSWNRFEAFCTAFVSKQAKVHECHRYGKQGSKQKGIDLFAVFESGERWAFQCKQVKKFTKADAGKAQQKIQYQADRYILFVSCDIDSTVRDLFPKEENWDIWDVHDISRRVRNLESAAASQIVEMTFGPHWRRAFLGAWGLTPFVHPQIFFQRWMDPARLFNHTWSLVGRSSYVDRLHQFANSTTERVAILAGRGGIGKTKLLHSFSLALQAASPSFPQYFIEEGVSITAESLDELPSTASIIFVDDAHRNESLSTLYSFIHQRQKAIKLILSTRSHGMDSLIDSLTRSGYDASHIVRLDEVKELSLTDVEDLGRQVLGHAHKSHAAALAQATFDCPLVTVVGGRLLALEKVNPALLANHAQFRVAVLDRFRDIVTGQVSESIPPDLCRRILDLIAGLSPIPTRDSTFNQAAAEFLRIDQPTLQRALSTLENGGILLKRGYTLRITPDVLADHILHKACVTEHGEPTGYAEQLFDKFAGVSPDKMLRNISELDWRIHQSGGRGSALLDNIWNNVEEEFGSAGHLKRSGILAVLKTSAYFQPSRMLRLVEYAMRNPASFTEDEHQRHTTTHEDVLQELPKLLQSIGYNLDYLPRCCDLLWQLGRDDVRPLHSTTDHGVRILSDLAGYDMEKPLYINRIILDAAKNWLDDEEAHFISPLDVIDPLLAKSDYSTKSAGHNLAFTSFHVSAEATASLREDALRIIETCAQSHNVRRKMRAIESLGKALRGPDAYFGVPISAEQRGTWVPEQLRVLEILKKLATDSDDPIARLEIIGAVRWEADRSPVAPVKEKAGELITAIEESYELRLCRILGDSFDRTLPPLYTDDDDGGYIKEQQRISGMVQEVLQEFLARHDTAAEGFSELGRRLEDFTVHGVHSNPGRLLEGIGNADVSYAIDLVKMIVQNPDARLADFLTALLVPIGNMDRGQLVLVCKHAVQQGHRTPCWAVARGYNCTNWLSTAQPQEIEYIHTLLSHDDSSVKGQAIESLRKLRETDPALAISMAFTVEIGDSVELAKRLSQTFSPRYGIPLHAMEVDNLSALLKKFEATKAIDDYSISEFLDAASKQAPSLVTRFLLNRIERAQAGTQDNYDPLPYLGFQHDLSGIVQAEDYGMVLREVRNRAINREGIVYFWLPKLYKQISGNLSQLSLDVLSEWIDSGEADKVGAAILLVSEAPNDFVIEQSEFCINALQKSHVLGEECHRDVRKSLFHSAASGVRSGTPGQPMPGDLALKEKARKVAAKLTVGSPEHNFYESLVRHATSQIEDKLAWDEELFDS